MIKNWEIISQVQSQNRSIHYTLVMDGTEHDARLMAKKLKGYTRELGGADSPYTYSFILDTDLDDNTLEKIRTAVEEVVKQSQTVDKMVPGGVLGDPLFNHDATALQQEFPTFLAPNPAELAKTINFKQVDLSEVSSREVRTNTQSSIHPSTEQAIPPELDIQQQTVFVSTEQTSDLPAPTAVPATNGTPTISDTPKENTNAASTISISDQDMLIPDMESSVFNKMPLEDILSAETKYDMFIDVEKAVQQTQQTQQVKEKKMEDANPQQSFNVFENDLKDQTNIIDVEEVQTITDQLTTKATKGMNEPKKPHIPQENSSEEVTNAQPGVPFTLGSSQDSKPKHILADVSNESIPEEEEIENTIPPQSIQERESLPEITVRVENPQLDKTFNLETTFNTEFLKKQEEKNRSLQEGRPAQPTPAQPAVPPQPPQKEGVLGKTILRLRRKGTAPATTLHSTIAPQNRAAKTKNIDRSIEMPVSELKKHNWPLEVPLVPTYTLNNMVMSVNRFAHATAVSVIENPGKLYNPFVLHGGTGTGKTHFLNALAYAFSKKFGQEHIFMTNGVRLSRGIQRYVMEGNIDKFENFMQSVRALLIDDIHLLAINEQNRAYISKLLNSFVQEQKQIVITSKYPPESLEKLEELIKFKLDAGWISELKPATGATHFRIVKKMLMENSVDLNDKQIEEFFTAPHMTLGTITRSIRRLKVLENLIFPNIPAEEKSHASIFEKLLATKGEDTTSELIDKDPSEITTLSTTGNGEWGRIGFFYPQNCSDMMNWMVYALQQRAKELHIEGGFEIVVRSSYATENIISSAFKIANLCDNKKLKGAVILGPMPQSCDPSVRENFYDILTHMLEIMLIRCGIINYENVRLPSTYVKVISELMR